MLRIKFSAEGIGIGGERAVQVEVTVGEEGSVMVNEEVDELHVSLQFSFSFLLLSFLEHLDHYSSNVSLGRHCCKELVTLAIETSSVTVVKADNTNTT